MRQIVLSLSFFMMLSAVLSGGEFNEVLNIGDLAPSWTDLPGTDEKKHSLEELSRYPVVVVAFTCASCPTAVDYEARIQEILKEWPADSGQVAVVLICVNNVESDKLPALKKRVDEKQLGFHFLHDETQGIAKKYGAIFTPEFYVLNRQRKVVYMGAMDDQTDPAKVTKRYVHDAIQATLEDKSPPVSETIARGCRVRYARERR